MILDFIAMIAKWMIAALFVNLALKRFFIFNKVIVIQGNHEGHKVFPFKIT